MQNNNGLLLDVHISWSCGQYPIRSPSIYSNVILMSSWGKRLHRPNIPLMARRQLGGLETTKLTNLQNWGYPAMCDWKAERPTLDHLIRGPLLIETCTREDLAMYTLAKLSDKKWPSKVWCRIRKKKKSWCLSVIIFYAHRLDNLSNRSCHCY